MKVALLTPTFMKYSGPDRVVENEAEEHVKKGDKVTVFTFRSDIRPKSYNVVELGMPSNPVFERIYRLFFFVDIFKVMKAVKQVKDYDLAVSFLYPMTIIAATARRYFRTRYVYYDVGVAYPELFSSPLERAYMRLFNFFTSFAVKNADAAVSISNFLRQELKRKAGLDSEVKYVKVDGSKYNKKLSRSRMAAIVKKHGLKKPVLLYVGRLSPHKGVHLLLEAFRIVKEKKPGASLVIVGKPTFDNYSKRLVAVANGINSKMPNSVIFTGFISDEELPYYFGACDLYTTATLWEGFDIPAVSAQMCGKKVIAFDVGSHPEVVKKGILVKKGDVKAFAQAIIRLLGK